MDFLPSAISGYHADHKIEHVWRHIYGIMPRPNVWMGLNLQWPRFNLPLHQELYVISWHTEYMDIEWLINQSKRVYPSQIINITDWPCDLSNLMLDNVRCLVYDTFAQQMILLTQEFGCANFPTKPQFKISSLSNRFSQYKKFVTAYLLANHTQTDMIMSWHNWIAKDADTHSHPSSFAKLNLDYSILDHKILINMPDDTHQMNQSPVSNGDWRVPAYVHALVNFTNESWHYSGTNHFGFDWIYPGPYLTEKTMKPLAAGRPFVSVGQYKTYDRLRSLGFRTDFGFDIDFDDDVGDLTRMTKIFSTIDQIARSSADDLFQKSQDSCRHNLDWINSKDLVDKCHHLNQASRDQLAQI